jgi:hypothetical protein
VRRTEGGGYVEQKLILGTHTSEDEDNYLLVAKVCMPADDMDIDGREGDGKQGTLRKLHLRLVRPSPRRVANPGAPAQRLAGTGTIRLWPRLKFTSGFCTKGK